MVIRSLSDPELSTLQTKASAQATLASKLGVYYNLTVLDEGK